jgi:hypothetical protein
VFPRITSLINIISLARVLLLNLAKIKREVSKRGEETGGICISEYEMAN